MTRDPSYSPDVEINHHGRVVFTRDIAAGEIIQMPVHLMRRVAMLCLKRPDETRAGDPCGLIKIDGTICPGEMISTRTLEMKRDRLLCNRCGSEIYL